jgi:hypothetical protein
MVQRLLGIVGLVACCLSAAAMGRRPGDGAEAAGIPPLPEWLFTDGSSSGWHAWGRWTEQAPRNGAWSLDADDSLEAVVRGGSLSLESPELDEPVTVSPDVVLEFELRSSRAGWVTLYYAVVTDAGKAEFGMLGAERRLVHASTDFQVLRLRPRWESGARVYRIRMDGPSFGGTLDLRSVRFAHHPLEPPSTEAGGASWDFRESRSVHRVLGPAPPPNLEASRHGVTVRGNDGPGMLTLDDRMVDADRNPWIRIRMRTDAGPLGGLAFHPTNRGTTEEMRRHWASAEFIKWFQFNVRPDGRFHTYNIRLSDYHYTTAANPHHHNSKRTGFEGGQRVFHLIPSHNPDAVSCVESVSFGPAPEGPPCLVTEYAGPGEAVFRTGRPGVVAVRVRNAGGVGIRDLRVRRIDRTPGLDVATDAVRGIPEVLAPDTTATLYLDVTPSAPGQVTFELAVECTGDGLAVPITLEVEHEVEGLEPGVIPEPRPLQTGYDIACYYFTGWSHLNHWWKMPSLAERRPALGYYHELTPEVADWDIKWAVEHGVNHFVVLWYHHNGEQHTRFIEDALLKARFLDHIEFSVMWCNAKNPWWKYTEQDFIDITDYWIREYFPLKQYKRDEQGRPLAWLLQGWNLVQHYGQEAAVRLVRDADRRAQDAGFPGIHWVACQHGGKNLFADPAALNEVGVQRWTAYNINGQTSYPYPVVSAQSVIDAAPVIWDAIPVTPVLPVFCGWESRWNGREFTSCYGFTPELFRAHLAQAKAYLDRNEGVGSLVIDCWNEWGEGEILGPHAAYGFELLRQIPAVFAPGEIVAPAVTPRDIGREPPEIPGLWEWVEPPPFRRE